MIHALSILGSTGSIGRQSLAAAERLNVPVRALAAHRNIDLLERQVRRFSPRLAAVYDSAAAGLLRVALADTPTKVVSGMEGLIEAASLEECDCVVTAVSGSVGLRPTLAAIARGKRIALANKETLVCAGELVMQRAREHSAEIVPVDSEHSAIFQSLGGRLGSPRLRSILLTASGGPFRGLTKEQTYHKTPAEAVAHPNWSMGAKISVDSATMMNKGLEFIEAMRLFSVRPEQIRVLIHPQSVVHSAVEFVDGSVIAQLGIPDMGLPIQYAMTWPDRMETWTAPLDLFRLSDLHFEAPDLENFPCLALAMDAAKRGGTAPAILSAANEAAVGLFLREKLPFGKIAECVAAALDSIKITEKPGLNELLSVDAQARKYVMEMR
ncbi:MAG: 1-deoxy-D-xylulose-5-phosphate reductoisomerase [Oscillospiraceae bacterium]|nr:1-deoxy-D-xylulose-5-phosphate reductoisomerase [Oscillospiraceae bacterium]